jgi:hypothetical protein
MSDLMSKTYRRAHASAPIPDGYSYDVDLTPEEEAWYAAKAAEIYGLNLPPEERARQARELAELAEARAPQISLPHIRPRIIER